MVVYFIAWMFVKFFHSAAFLYASTADTGTYTGIDLLTFKNAEEPQVGGTAAIQVIAVKPEQS